MVIDVKLSLVASRIRQQATLEAQAQVCTSEDSGVNELEFGE